MSFLCEHLMVPGEIAVMATDTVYGVVARAVDAEAVARLYRLKHREGKPGTLIAGSVEQLVALGIEQSQLDAVSQFWPDAVSVIVDCGPELSYLHQGIGSLAVRIPNNDRLAEILAQTGPLLTSSANQPGEPPARTIDEARHYFGEQVSWYENDGYVDGPPSTVIKVINNQVSIVRQGVVTIAS